MGQDFSTKRTHRSPDNGIYGILAKSSGSRRTTSYLTHIAFSMLAQQERQAPLALHATNHERPVFITKACLYPRIHKRAIWAKNNELSNALRATMEHTVC
jgi:hypothetical protein